MCRELRRERCRERTTVRKGYALCVKPQPARERRHGNEARRLIPFVADDRVLDRLQVSPDLMLPTGLRSRADEAEPAEVFSRSVACDRLERAAATAIIKRLAHDALLAGSTDDERNISLVDLAVPEHPPEGAPRLGALGIKHDPRSHQI